MKKFALLALAIPALALLFACTDAGDPYVPEMGEVTATATVDLMDWVGDWDALYLNGDLTGGTPQAMTQDGPMWMASVSDLAPGTYAYGVYYDDGNKALQPVLSDLTITVSDAGVVSGDAELVANPGAGTGFNLIVENNNPTYDNIKFKGEYTGDGWATVDRTGMSDDGLYVYRHIDAGLAEATYQWGVIHDDGSEWGIWLIEGDNPTFDIDAAGAVTGTVTYTIPSPTPSVNVTFNVDMNAETVSGDGVRIAGNFGADGYAEWNPGEIVMTDDDEDGVYSIVMELSADTHYEFVFINGSSWDGQEDVPEVCGVDNNNGGFNRILDTLSDDTSYTAAYGACPAK